MAGLIFTHQATHMYTRTCTCCHPLAADDEATPITPPIPLLLLLLLLCQDWSGGRGGGGGGGGGGKKEEEEEEEEEEGWWWSMVEADGWGLLTWPMSFQGEEGPGGAWTEGGTFLRASNPLAALLPPPPPTPPPPGVGLLSWSLPALLGVGYSKVVSFIPAVCCVCVCVLCVCVCV